MDELLRSLLATSATIDPTAAAVVGALLGAAPLGHAFFDRELRIAAANPAFAALVSAPPGVPLQGLVAEAFAGGAALAALAAEVRDTGVARQGERWMHLRVHCYPLGGPGGVTGVGCILEPDREPDCEPDREPDHTRLAEAERDQAIAREHRTREDAHAAARFEDGLLAAMSHDLRAPLATVIVWNEALRDNPLNEALRERAHEAIQQSALAQSRLLDSLLDLAWARRGTLQLNLQPVAAADEFAAALERVRPAATTKSLVLELRCEPDVGEIQGDRNRLRQVFEQLLSNAVKFTGPGGRVTATARRSGDAVELAVADTGAGIRPERIARIFEPFRHTEGAGHRSGLGIGLAVARAIIEAHGGTLRAESGGVGQGATFRVTLRGPAHAQASPWASHALGLRGFRVLIVDDHPDTLEALAILLRSAGAVVETATSAAAAWDAIERSAPDVLLSDLELAGDDGHGLIRRVRASATTRNLYAVALTGLAFPRDRERALAAGFDMYVIKPVELDELAEILARARPAVR